MQFYRGDDIFRSGIYKVFGVPVTLCAVVTIFGSGGAIDMNSLFFGTDGTMRFKREPYNNADASRYKNHDCLEHGAHASINFSPI